MLKATCAKCKEEFPQDLMHDVVGQDPRVGKLEAKVCKGCLSEIFTSPFEGMSIGCKAPMTDDEKMKSFFRAIGDSPSDIMHGTVKPTKKEN